MVSRTADDTVKSPVRVFEESVPLSRSCPIVDRHHAAVRLRERNAPPAAGGAHPGVPACERAFRANALARPEI